MLIKDTVGMKLAREKYGTGKDAPVYKCHQEESWQRYRDGVVIERRVQHLRSQRDQKFRKKE